MSPATPTIPLAPKTIKVSDPTRGRFNMLGTGESDMFRVTVDDISCSITVNTDRGDEIAWMDWPERIAAIAEETRRWVMDTDHKADCEAIHEWINRDDPEDERLIAIEEAQTQSGADKAVRQLRALPRDVRERVTAELATNPL